MKDHCVLVFGSYVNSYCIIRELYEKGIREIVVFDFQKRCAAYSNKIKKFVQIDKDPYNLMRKLLDLHEEYEYIIIFPTDELHIEMLLSIYDHINSFCFLPFNERNFFSVYAKYDQYLWCKKLKIPCPKTILLDKPTGYGKILKMLKLPVIIKPNVRYDIEFKNMRIYTQSDHTASQKLIEKYLYKGIKFVVSEIISGNDDQIFAYICYRNRNGDILNEWAGNKLSQHPNSFGTFASARNLYQPLVVEQSRKLVEEMNVFGIASPEFKYDFRDGTYKIIEINFRSMMWNRIGNLSGVYIQYTQYLDAIRALPIRYSQITNQRIHLCYFKYELLNLLYRPNYFKTFIKNLFVADKIHFCIFDWKDVKPFFVDFIDLLKRISTKNRRFYK